MDEGRKDLLPPVSKKDHDRFFEPDIESLAALVKEVTSPSFHSSEETKWELGTARVGDAMFDRVEVVLRALPKKPENTGLLPSGTQYVDFSGYQIITQFFPSDARLRDDGSLYFKFDQVESIREKIAGDLGVKLNPWTSSSGPLEIYNSGGHGNTVAINQIS